MFIVNSCINWFERITNEHFNTFESQLSSLCSSAHREQFGKLCSHLLGKW